MVAIEKLYRTFCLQSINLKKYFYTWFFLEKDQKDEGSEYMSRKKVRSINSGKQGTSYMWL